MEGTTTGQFFFFATVLGLICSVTTTVLAIIQTKTMIASLPTGWQRTRLAACTWLITLFFFAGVITHGFMTNPSVIVKAFTNRGETPQQNPTPPIEMARTENRPAPVLRASPAPKPVPPPNPIDTAGGVYFAVDNRRYDYSPNALMGKFEGNYKLEPGGIRIFVPSPIIRLAGKTTNPGAREILSVEVAVGDYEDLLEISESSKARGGAAWSKPFNLKGEVWNHQDDRATQQKNVELFVKGQFTDLAHKTLLIKIHNKFVGAHEELFPGYILCTRNLFSAH